MPTFKLIVAYDGTQYHGWQIQPGLPTIQELLQKHLARILGHRVGVYGAGRTDAGVHAKGQTAHFRTSRAMEIKVLGRALNATLPHDIVIRKIEEVSPDFHAQFDAKGKEYRYYLFNHPVRSPFYRKYSLFVPISLDLDHMREALSHLVGTHDFYSLSVASEDKENTVRTITRAELIQEGDLLTIILEGNGFLHKMVRRIVGTILEVGRQKMSAGTIPDILKTRDKRLSGGSAPPNGLFLVSVRY
jgi:tRNA pseudouridine38-40 synthase